MDQSEPAWKQRQTWTWLMGLAAAAFWLVGIGCGARGWILAAGDRGLVAHAQAFGDNAFVYWIPASVLTLTVVVMAIGTSVVRRLVDGPVEIRPRVASKDPKTPKRPAPTDEASIAARKAPSTPGASDDDASTKGVGAAGDGGGDTGSVSKKR